MQKYKLSVCIPTYNRGEFIGQTIQSIIDAAEGIDGIEIAISDNSSTDNTREVIEHYRKKFTNITYFCWDKNMGADRNFLKVVEIASGEYCWLMGSDDKAEKNSISLIMTALEQYGKLSGITLNERIYDSKLVSEIFYRPPTKNINDVLYNSNEKCFSELGHYFGYISAQVVNRKLWQDVVKENNVEEYFNAYVHVYVIAKMLEKNANWLYINTKCVGWRSGNDSFLSDGRLRRLAIDVFGYEKIARDVYGKNSLPYNELLKAVCGRYVWCAILGAKANGEPIWFYKKAFKMCFDTYKQFPIFWLKVFPLFLIPSKAMPLARVIYRKFFKKYV